MTTTLTAPRARTTTFRAAPTAVDAESRVIRGFQVISTRVLEDRDGEIDDVTLDQVVALGQAAGPQGVKSRFTHPNLSRDGLAKYLGRARDFRRQGNTVVADLHLAPSSQRTPGGDLGSYVLERATEDPASFGASIAFRQELETRRAADGTPAKGPDGKRLPPLVRVKKLLAVDIVDEPAATDGLFSAADPPDYAARAATGLLDWFAAREDESAIRQRVDAFLARYFGRHAGHTTNPERPPVMEAPITPTIEELSAPLAAFSALTPADVEAAAQAAAARATEAAFAAERERSSTIAALCEQAGCPDRVARYVSLGTSVATVQTELFQHVCAQRPVLGDGGSREADLDTEPDARLRREFAAFQRQSKADGLSFDTNESEYILGARINAGLEPLLPAAK